ncbi:MAG: hydroxyisourate hydrolase [Candidatus Limnocylindria bacterium]
MTDSTLSTHVLDVTTGAPAVGATVELYQDGAMVGASTTDADGRIASLGAELAPGRYRLVFETGTYFAARPSFLVRVSLDIDLPSGHSHVPLLVSPFSCVSYRGR